LVLGNWRAFSQLQFSILDEIGFYAEGVTFQSPGSRLAAHPGIQLGREFYPEGVAQPIGATPSGQMSVGPPTQGGAASPLTLALWNETPAG
jgi:hypothetical protein